MGDPLGEIGSGFSAVINGVEHVAQDAESLVSKATGDLELLGIGTFGRMGDECFFSISQQTIPFGEHYASWKAEMNKKMQGGKELYYLGNPDHFPPKDG